MRTLLFFFIIDCCQGLLAQQVVATAGSTHTSSTGSISFTIGEGVSQTLANGDKTLTQGFHQTYISVSIISELKDIGFDISVFPNPVSDELTLKLSDEILPGLQLVICDMNGKLILQKVLKGLITKIPVNQLPAGLYIIKVKDSTKELKTFKIVKE
jgi:hypothetical protein